MHDVAWRGFGTIYDETISFGHGTPLRKMHVFFLLYQAQDLLLSRIYTLHTRGRFRGYQ